MSLIRIAVPVAMVAAFAVVAWYGFRRRPADSTNDGAGPGGSGRTNEPR